MTVRGTSRRTLAGTGFLILLGLVLILATGGANGAAGQELPKPVPADRQVKNAKDQDQDLKKLMDEVARLRAALDKQVADAKTRERELTAEIQRMEKALRRQKDLAEQTALNLEKQRQECERLAAEVKLLAQTVARREQLILTLEVNLQKATDDARAQRDAAATAKARLEDLFKKLKDGNVALAKALAEAPPRNPKVPPGKANFQNPPPVNVKGLIQAIDKEDPSLVQISLGTDAGLKKDHTLEVYRLSPQPMYLGRLLILETQHASSIGRVIPPPGAPPVKLLEGDRVGTILEK
jgi:hypothetical protein